LGGFWTQKEKMLGIGVSLRQQPGEAVSVRQQPGEAVSEHV